MMDRVIRGLPFVFCYLDDLRVASRSPQEHINHLFILFKRLREFSLVINLEVEKRPQGSTQGDQLGAYWMKRLLDRWAGGAVQMAWMNSQPPHSSHLARAGCLM